MTAPRTTSGDDLDAASAASDPTHPATQGRPTLAEAVQAAGRRAGLDATGVTSTEPFAAVRADLHSRKARGQHAGMSFTFKDPRRSTEPARLLRNAASLVVGARGYAEAAPDHPGGAAAAVARYAWRDHYAVLRDGLEAMAVVLRDAGHRAVVVADQNSLVDRAAAHRAGIGWWGKNSNLLIPGAGSWFVLGSVATDAVLESRDTPVEDGCRTCRRCIDACPTNAIVADGVIDARRCLAWLVQDHGVFPRQHRAALGNRIYGCDDCQDVCPPGRRTVGDPVGIGPVADVPVADVPVADAPVDDAPVDGGPEAWVDVVDLLDADDETILARHGRWYVPRRQARYLRRNALIVLGNVGDPDDPAHRRVVTDALAGDDALVRAHAVWTAARLGFDDLVEAASDDPDAVVRAEVALAPTVPRRAEPPHPENPHPENMHPGPSAPSGSGPQPVEIRR